MPCNLLNPIHKPAVPRDDRTAAAVKTAIEELRELGSEAAELRCPPLRMTPGFLAERIRGLDRATSEKVRNIVLGGNAPEAGG